MRSGQALATTTSLLCSPRVKSERDAHVQEVQSEMREEDSYEQPGTAREQPQAHHPTQLASERLELERLRVDPSYLRCYTPELKRWRRRKDLIEALRRAWTYSVRSP